MTKPLLLDLFCGAGGAAMGYHRAEFEMIGVDINPQPNYPFEFHQGDALKFLLEHYQEFDVYHASPPCQAWTKAQRIQNNEHPDFVTPTRVAFNLIGKPWVIENVPESPLIEPVELCGCMFPELRTYRPRWFESNIDLARPLHKEHVAKNAKMGRRPKDDEFMHIVGNFSDVRRGREAMGIPWMTRDELSESIPPSYTEFVGWQMHEYLILNGG